MRSRLLPDRNDAQLEEKRTYVRGDCWFDTTLVFACQPKRNCGTASEAACAKNASPSARLTAAFSFCVII